MVLSLQLRVEPMARVLVTRWMRKIRKRSRKPWRTVSHGWTPTPRLMPRISRRNTKKSRESVHPSSPNTTELELRVVPVAPRKRKMTRHMMSCKHQESIAGVGSHSVVVIAIVSRHVIGGSLKIHKKFWYDVAQLYTKKW